MEIDLVVDGEANADLLDHPMAIEENMAMSDLMSGNDMIFIYKGDFNDETISPMLNILEKNSSISGDSIGYKIYHAAVELSSQRHHIEL